MLKAWQTTLQRRWDALPVESMERSGSGDTLRSSDGRALSSIMRDVLARPASLSEARVAFGKCQRKFRKLGEEVVPGVVSTERFPRVEVGCEYNARDGMRPGHSRRKVPAPKEASGAIPLIFEFYSKLQSPGYQMGRGLTYDEIANCNERLSFFELICFCRDFKVVPDLVAKSTVSYVWKIATSEAGRSGLRRGGGGDAAATRDAGLGLDEFLALLVRLSLVAYATAAIGKPELAVRRMVSFLKLDDIRRVRHVIKTQGRETQRHVNFRSAGELEMGYGRKALAEKKVDLSRRLRKASRAAIAFSSSQLALLDSAPRQGDYSSGTKDGFLGVASRVLLASFDKAMASLLEPYCSLTAAQHWVPFDTCGADCGTLDRGRRYSVRINILNASDQTLVVLGARTRGDAAPAVRAIFDPNPFVPGLTRTVELLVEPLPAQGGEFAGRVDVDVGAGARAERGLAIAVPLFYRIESTHVASHAELDAAAHQVGFPVNRPLSRGGQGGGGIRARGRGLHDSSLDSDDDDDGDGGALDDR